MGANAGPIPDEVGKLDQMAIELPAEMPSHTQEGIYPSRGYRYGGAHEGGRFHMRMMTTEDEELMAGAAKHSREHLIDELLRRCWIRPEIAYEQLLLADKFYMLFFLRAISLSPKYKFEIQCSGCQLKFEHEVQIPEGLEKRELEPGDAEPFYADLPILETRVGLRLLRVEDEVMIRRQADRAYAKSLVRGDPAYSLRLAAHVVTVGGKEVDAPTARNFVRKLTSRDSVAIRNAIDKNDIGISLKINATCRKCGEEVVTTLPFTDQFFRPDD